jgi:hypothetical protein
MSPASQGSIEERYKFLSTARESYCQRAEECSAYTDPYIFPTEGMDGEKIAQPWQSIGAEGVTSLSSRILSIVLPPNRPPFRLRVERSNASEEEKKQWQEIEAGLSRMEHTVTAHIESLGDRVVLAEAIPHLLVTGNVLLHVRKDGMRLHNLRDYVVVRNPRGECVEIIVEEKIDPRFIKNDSGIIETPEDNGSQPADKSQYKPLYTQVKKVEKGWTVVQECNGKIISHGRYLEDQNPWLPLRMYRISGEDYGRSYVEKYLGDHKSLDALSQAIVEGTSALARVIVLLNPAGIIKAKDLEKAGNLAILSGTENDVSILQANKAADFQIAKALIDTLQQRLSRAYLLNSAIQRDAERVTAEEIRYMAQELESALGGLYSVLAAEFQRPYILLRMEYMFEQKLLDSVLRNVNFEIVTGVDALGRGQDANRLIQFAEVIAKTITPQAAIPYLKVDAYLKALASALGIDDVSLLRSEQEMQQQNQQQQQQAMLEKVAPNAVNQLGGLIGKSMENQMPQGE